MTSPATRCTRWPSSPRDTRAQTSPASQGGAERRSGLVCVIHGDASIYRDAAYGPIRELKMDEVKSLDPVELRKVDMNDFLDSMKKMKKSVSPDSLAPFETWNHKFGEGSG